MESSILNTYQEMLRSKGADQNHGYTTEEALIRLHDDVKQEVDQMKEEFSKRSLVSWLKESISFKSELSKMRWPSVLFMAAQAIAHFIVAFVLQVENLAVNWIGFQGFIITILLVFNLTVNLWDTKLRFKELLMKSEQILKLIKQCSKDDKLLAKWRLYSWDSADAKTLFIPKSPCVQQTLTYRDESCLNLPDYLLVKGDIIHLYPGERAPGNCISLDPINISSKAKQIYLEEGQIFHTVQRDCVEEASELDGTKDKKNLLIQFSHARLKKSNKGRDFIMLSTPYIKSLRITLQRSHKRPVNSIEKECFIISRKYFETFVIPSVFVMSTIVTAIHYGYLDLTDSDQEIKTISIAYLLLRPSLTIMPFLPWMFPCFWLAVNAYGSARLLCCAENQKEKARSQSVDPLGYSPRGENFELASEQAKFQENLLSTPKAGGSDIKNNDGQQDLGSDIKFMYIFHVFIDLIRGKGGHVWRSSNLLQVLGCLTSFCCIDKVGILSWSNPTPEKVFILTKNEHEESSSSPAEILDVSQSLGNQNQLQFDDLNWRKYLCNLKPLGLAVLLNNCCESSFGDYFRFYKHISYESILRCDITPVVKRRCICALSKLIGLTKKSTEDYKYCNQIGIYKFIDPRSIQKGKLVSSLENATRLKLPFSNMICNVQQDTITGSYQVFSQGTADIIMDACVEYWDGETLKQLDETARKKIMDFYHRTSLTSYCSTFAYTPILKPHHLNQYIELPPENSKLVHHQITRRHMSTENLDEQDDGKEETMKEKKLDDTLDELTDQVFVGMVAVQYQACPDFVALVEQLELACIRFVHFSKENELRSRVFSEKMGLESGWNCHISLQSDQDLDKAEKGVALKSLNYQGGDCSKQKTFTPSTRIASILTGQSKDTSYDQSTSSDEKTLYPSQSLPSLVMHYTAKLLHHPNSQEANKDEQSSSQFESSGEQLAPASDDSINPTDVDMNQEQAKEDEFETLAFDMSNRAKLPRGIENIRPHLETVDNVPLQVSLFTDCTPELTQEMIEIMQDYGEIVCVLGSSASRSNTGIFLQANASIAVEPLMPQSCTRSDENLVEPSKKETKKKRTHQKREGRYKRRVEPEHTVINMLPRPNNPRDRLGIGSTEMATVSRPKRRDSTSSSSSSSSDSSSSSKSTHSSSSRSSTSSESDCESHEEAPIFEKEPPVDPIDELGGSRKSLCQLLPDPCALASKLASLPCSYSYNRKDPVNLYSLIMEARHFTFKMKNTFVCMICFALSISSAQFLASILFLPPMLSSGLTIWLTVVVVPLMSFSLMSTTMDSQVMKIAVGKNLQLKPENITFFVICYLIKFIPSIIVVVLNFGLIIAHSCKLTGFGSSSLGPCWMFTYVQHGNSTSSNGPGDEDLLWSNHLLTAQVCAAFLLVLYFVVISAGFVHRSHLMWQRSPTRNKFWVAISLLLIFGQLIYNQLVLQINLGSSKIPYQFLASLPLHIWLISFMWPVIVIIVNLLVKQAEVKATIRQQRRARFDFNTKLGMNSPF